MTQTNEASASLDRTSPAMIATMATDRAAAWAELRAQGPVFKDAQGIYCVTSHAACHYVLQHPEIFSSAEAFKYLAPFTLVPIGIDPPQHALPAPHQRGPGSY